MCYLIRTSLRVLDRRDDFSLTGGFGAEILIGVILFAGAITAALFLQEFVNEVPWAHLDIAGPAFASKDHLTCPKGGTGFGVRTLLKLLSGM